MLKILNILNTIDGISSVKEIDSSSTYKNKRFLEMAEFVLNGMTFEMLIPEIFPYKLPIIVSKDKLIHSHINEKGIVCLPNVQDIVYDPNDQDQLIKKTVNALKRLFTFSKEKNEEEIAFEYNDYLDFFTNHNSDYERVFLFSNEKDGYLFVQNKVCFIGKNPLINDYKTKNNILNPTIFKYVMLDLMKMPNISRRELTALELLECLDQRSKQRIVKIKNESYIQFYVLRYRNPDGFYNYILVTAKLNKKCKKTNAFINKSPVFINPVINLNMDYLRLRGGSNLFENNILLVGCGSVGGEVCDQLISCGFINISIVDYDCLVFENGFRNNTGFSYLSLDGINKKTAILAKHFKKKYPDANITSYDSDIIELIKSNEIDLEKYKYIISCTGNTIMDSFLNDYLYKNSIATILVIGWLEPYGIAEHILTIDTTKKGCFDCFIKSPFSISIASGDENYKLRNNVCTGSFTPFGRIHATRLAINIVDLILKNELGIAKIINRHNLKKRDASIFLSKGFKKTKNMELSDSEFERTSRDFIREGCNACGKFGY